MLMFVLYEHASGYSLFTIKEFEEISILHRDVEASIPDFGKFAGLVKLHAFAPFKSGTNALDNINSISEGVLHEDLQLFLETNLPESSKKRKKLVLGVGESKIAAAIQEAFGVTCETGNTVTEIHRGLRSHFHRMVKGLTAQSEAKAQLGLGHSYSRAKVKFNVNRVDNMIIQSISLLDQLDKDVNTFSMRIKEWYSYHFPELVKVIPDSTMYAKVVSFIKNRKNLTEEHLDGLEEITMDSAKAKAVLDASRSSMGMDISDIDLINIERFTSRVIALSEYRQTLHTYLKDRMGSVAPNLSALIGEQVGARLISHAGSLTSLAKYPASTVQILGAEKALFRALKNKGNTPKYGLIFHSTFIGRAAQKNKGRISRYLANKCSMASRIDCFADAPSSVYGEKLRDQVEERLSFYETGDAPRKNIDIMREAMEEAKVQEAVQKKKKKKDKKKRKLEDANGVVATETKEPVVEQEMGPPVEQEMGPPKKKKKKKHHREAVVNGEGEDVLDGTLDSTMNSTLDSTMNSTMNSTLDSTLDSTTDGTPKKKKKKKKKNRASE